MGAHFPVTVAFLAGLFIWRRGQYPRIRNALAATTALGLAIHVIYPLAPPRLLGDADMVDTGSVFGPSPYRGAVRGAANQFAAITSVVVIITANHYWIDGAAGTLIALIALRLTRPRLAMHAMDEADIAPARINRRQASSTVRRIRRSACPPHATSPSSAFTPPSKAETSVVPHSR